MNIRNRLCALVACTPILAFSGDVEDLKKELQTLRAEYEGRIARLERKLADVEAEFSEADPETSEEAEAEAKAKAEAEAAAAALCSGQNSHHSLLATTVPSRRRPAPRNSSPNRTSE